MNKIYIFKLGSTYPDIAHRLGDFDLWTKDALGTVDIPVEIVDLADGALLPPHKSCAGVLLTGAHEMVTDAIPWIAAVEHWISACIKQSIPLLGICFGHQLIIQAAGGRIDYHPQGLEIGTVTIHTLRHAAEDRLLNGIPKVFTAHVSHSQTAVALPGDAVRLAENSFEKSHIVRIGSTAWGLQFHPEFSTEVMCSYIEHHAAQIRSHAGSPEQHIKMIAETPFPLKIMRNFYHIIRDASV